MIFKDSIPTSDRTGLFLKVTSPLMLFSEIITIYSANHMKHIKTIVEKNAEILKFIPNGTLHATGLLMFNSSIKAKTDRIFQFIYEYTYIYIHTHTHSRTQRFAKQRYLRT